MTDRQKSRDDFWDLDKMLPGFARSTPNTSASFVRNTEVVEITVDSEDGDGAKNEVRIPPIPNITTRLARAAYRARHRAEDSDSPASRKMHTPGDVSPKMAQPVWDYEVENSFVKHVAVFRWPERFSYFEKFTADAERYFNRTADACPFVNFFAYMPQYSNLSQDQLRYYLYWRDNVRHGVYLTSDYSYIFLYVYEIINLPEKIKPRDGIRLLCDIWLAYRERFPRLDRYMGEWVCDYCLIHKLPAPLERLADIIPTLVSILTFREFYITFDAKGDCPITAGLCDILTGAAWKQSKYLTPQTRLLFEEHLYASVLGALRHAWLTDDDFVSLLGFSVVTQSRNAFSGALCTYACKRRIDVSYLSLSRSYQLKFIVSDLFKLAENCIRAHLGIRARLNTTGIPETLKSYVKGYFAEKLPPPEKPPRKTSEARAAKAAEERKREEAAYAHYYEPLSSVLSTDNAIALEADSWRNTALLTKDEEATSALDLNFAPSPLTDTQSTAVPMCKAENMDTDDTMCDDPHENLVRRLSEPYYTALKHILCGERDAFFALCATHALLPDAVVDGINELAVTYTDDTVLFSSGDFFAVYDFYANNVMNAVVAREEEQ